MIRFSKPKQVSTWLNDVLPKLPALKVIEAQDFIKLELPPREHILAPWLPVQGLAMIYAPRGIGKTHIALGIAFAVTTNTPFLNWQPMKARSVLYIDGEMPASLMQERLATMMNTQKVPFLQPLQVPKLHREISPSC